MTAPGDTPQRDTATGTDPDAKYEEPGYEDKSFGQAVDQDQATVDRLLDETDGDEAEAEARFERESAGAPAAARQASAEHKPATGERKAAQNRAEEPPA